MVSKCTTFTKLTVLFCAESPLAIYDEAAD